MSLKQNHVVEDPIGVCITHPKRINWKSQPNLGRVSDTQLAHELGVTAQAVRYARLRLGIPQFRGKARLGRKGINWDLEPLGDVSDSVLAKKHQVCESTVSAARRLRKIQSKKRKNECTQT